ncbi:MAG: sulfonate transport system permease protein [Solirubrobacteraceae bacterium]|jgi:ABC-type nitrate/sulfonate/bicarbonate transport system permease component|nr:sulfonate transport system permease protein [Solirubrobacteraceae bacterium]
MATPRRFRLGRLRKTTLLSLVVVVVLWIVVSLIAGRDGSGQRMVPGPVDIVAAFKHFADYWPGGMGVRATQLGGHITVAGAILGFLYNTGLTLMHTIGGVVLGTAVAIGLAVAVSWSPNVRQAVSIPAHVGRLLPLLAMTSLFALWFGDSHLGVILFVAFTSFALVFPIALNSIGNVPAYYGQYARSLGASGRRTYFEVILPAGLPPIRSGVLLALGFGWSSAIAAEYITAQYGLGHIVKNAEYFARTGLLGLVGLVALLLAGASLYLADRGLRWLTRWAD